MAYPVIQLKMGREASVGFHHPWVFSGAIESIPDNLDEGVLVHVADRNGRIIGTGTFEGDSSIAVRVFDFSETEITEEWITSRIEQANNQRLLLGYGPDTDTTGYRIVFGEADNMPGLVIDRYANVLVVQISTTGMSNLSPIIIRVCKKLFDPIAIIDRSEGESNVVDGKAVEAVEFLEHGMKVTADVINGQKTGFFFDQKELRQAVKKYAHGKTVLNAFSYTGATGIAALLGGAASVYNVDESKAALEACVQHATLNGIDSKKITTQEADAFAWLGAQKDAAYDMVIIDPPALAKTKREIEQAKKAYHFVNRAGMRLVKDGGVFVTSSCSHFFTEDDFAYTLRRASVQAGLQLDVLEVIRQASDHPLSVYFPESLYLKSFICRVRKVK